MRLFLAMLRESRGSRGRLVFFTLCLAIGVAAVVGVATLAAALQETLRAESRNLLAADLVVESRRPIEPQVEAMVRAGGADAVADVREFPSMVTPIDAEGEAGASRLARIKSVRGAFPFYGALTLDPPGPLAAALARGVVVAPELGVVPGDRLRLGDKVLPVAALLRSEPQQLGFMDMFGPRVFVADEALADSGLLGSGSRMRYQLLVRHPGPAVETLAARLRRDAPGAEYLRVETWRQGQPQVRAAIDRVERFLGLVALLSLILGGIGVAQIVQAWLASRTESIAILRCLGMRPREILALFLGQVAVLAVLGSALGAATGSVLPLFFADLLAGALQADLRLGPMLEPVACLRGFGLGVGIALLFSLPPLTAVWRVSPARVLRAEAEPLAAPWAVRAAAFALLAGGLLATAWLQAGRFSWGLWFTLFFAALVAVLTVGARVLMWLCGRIPRARFHPYLAQGLAAVARPGAGTTGGIVALGLGVTVVATMAIVEAELSTSIRTLIPRDAPSVFLVDVQPDQWPGVQRILTEQGAARIDSAAIVMGRLQAINGRSVADIARDRGGRAKWTLTREQRIAPLAELPANNTIVAGELWSDPDVHELSLEADYAEDMGVRLGDVLRIDVQGVAMDFTLTSLRRVEWRSLSLNFFVAVEPGPLDSAPGFRFASAKLPEDREQALQDRLAAAFPNVTVIRLRPIVESLAGLLSQLAIGVRLLGGFTVLAGLAILAGAISATTLRRRREAALLKTLGATRRGVGALLLTEYGLLGAVAGLLGACGAILLAWGFLAGLADLPFGWPLWVVPLAALAAALLAGGCGVLASLQALRAPPRESLSS